MAVVKTGVCVYVCVCDSTYHLLSRCSINIDFFLPLPWSLCLIPLHFNQTALLGYNSHIESTQLNWPLAYLQSYTVVTLII